MTDLELLRECVRALHEETCAEGGQDFEPSGAYLSAMAGLDRLEAASRLLPMAPHTWPQVPERVVNGRPISEMDPGEREHMEFAERMGW